MGLAGDGRLEIELGAADGEPGRRVANRLHEFEMAMRVAGLAFGGRAEDGGDVVVAFDVGLLSEVEVTAVGLAFTGERGLQVTFGL